MVRTLLIAGAVTLWATALVMADDPAGIDAGEAYEHGGQAGDAPPAAAAKEPGKIGLAAPKVSAGQIAKDPAQYYDKDVEVKAGVAETYGANAFALDEDAIFAGPDVLVIAPQLGSIDSKSTVTVRGKVRQFVTAELEEDYTWFRSDSIQPDLLVRFKERPVIIAESVQLATGEELVTGRGEKPSAGDAPKPNQQPGAGEPDGMDADDLLPPMNQ
jgi:hypothetical protein